MNAEVKALGDKIVKLLNGLTAKQQAAVHDQIERVVTVMKLCENMDDFREKFARVFKKTAVSQLDFNWSEEA